LQGTTTIVINDGDEQFDLVAGSQTRAKRSISSVTKDVYVALEADESSRLKATFKATGSLTKAVMHNSCEFHVHYNSYSLITCSLSGGRAMYIFDTFLFQMNKNRLIFQ